MRSREGGRPQGRRYKDLQLCKQTEEALQLALLDHESGLSELSIADVSPSPSVARLLVTLVMPRLAGEQEPMDTPSLESAAVATQREQFLALLHEHVSDLRDEIAANIHRKRTPELVFRVVAPWEMQS